MAKLRHGRKQGRNLYLQLGDEPSDEDEYVGVIFDPDKARILVDIVNGQRSALDVMRLPWHPAESQPPS